MTPIQALTFLYEKTKLALLTADEHKACAELFLHLKKMSEPLPTEPKADAKKPSK